jgi:hypothetical protein
MKTKLIALVALAMIDHAYLPADVAAGAEFEVDAGDAEALLTNGKAELAAAPLATPPAKTKTVKARVLTACQHGQPNDLAELPADVAKQAEKDGLVDTDKAAVAYAMSLKKSD